MNIREHKINTLRIIWTNNQIGSQIFHQSFSILIFYVPNLMKSQEEVPIVIDKK